MKKTMLLIFSFMLVALVATSQSEPFSKRLVITLPATASPWEVVYGPNDSLWVTEAKGYQVDRIKVSSGAKTKILDLTASKTDWNSGTGPQGGLMGIALHPALFSSNAAVRSAKPWVYIVYVYAKATPNSPCNTPGVTGGCPFSSRLVRYDYTSGGLVNPVTIMDPLPGSSDHNSGRLVISPYIEPGADAAHTQYRLYYTIGDMGAGQLTNTLRTENAQNVDVTEGKVLRLNTESDGDAGQDAWVPNDNPFYDGAPITGKDYVFSLGHRNPQGLVWANVYGQYMLYSSEQSDRADDEVNIIQAGHNYGWDKVSGKCDGDVNGFQIGGTNVVNEIANCAGTTEPIFTLFHHNTTWPTTYPSNGSANAQWPTVAASSITFYGKQVIPGWPCSLLISPLKDDKVYRLKLNTDGSINGDTISYFRGDGNRIRRIISDNSGYRFYVLRDDNTIREYTYTGVTLPVELEYFKGALKNNIVGLEWATTSQVNSSKFVVERSTDGSTYNDIATIDAAGSNSTDLTYTYDDTHAVTQQSNVLYYRVRMVDIDGNFKYSNVITITLSNKVKSVIVSPNPASSSTKVMITVDAPGSAQWKIVDNAGATVLQSSIELVPGINTTTLNLTTLPAGIYYLNIVGNGVNQNVKLQKL